MQHFHWSTGAAQAKSKVYFPQHQSLAQLLPTETLRGLNNCAWSNSAGRVQILIRHLRQCTREEQPFATYWDRESACSVLRQHWMAHEKELKGVAGQVSFALPFIFCFTRWRLLSTMIYIYNEYWCLLAKDTNPCCFAFATSPPIHTNTPDFSTT